MKQAETSPVWVVVTGANGRIGRALRAVWRENTPGNQPILWLGRGSDGSGWDIGQNPPPDLPEGAVVLHLAGRVSGTAEVLAENVGMTAAVCAAAVAARARHVFVMSSVAVYAPGPLALTEGDMPAPISPYGMAKLEAERAAVAAVQGSATGLTLLRLGNLAGADALLGVARPMVVLDPVAGQAGGPERSYIGPLGLARVLGELIGLVVQGRAVPGVVNVAQPPGVAMADLLTARGQAWQFGPPRVGAVARVVVATDRLASLIDLPQTSAAALIAELNTLPGWP